MTRPTDEITGKVVAKWYGLGMPIIYEEVDGTGYFVWLHPGQRKTREVDPRTDTDVALELLYHLDDCYTFELIANAKGEAKGWSVRNWNAASHGPMPFLPISGEAFRYAVVTLAADVLGVG